MTFYVFLSCLTRFLEHWSAANPQQVVRHKSASNRRPTTNL